jgi:hypothetical protein
MNLAPGVYGASSGGKLLNLGLAQAGFLSSILALGFSEKVLG